MTRSHITFVVTMALATLASGPASAQTCPPDSVKVGTLCVDKYEASVWALPANNSALLDAVRDGTATAADLVSGGALQRGPAIPFTSIDDYACSNTGNNCNQIFAASVSGVYPSVNITWFQAQRACANSHKRLLTNAEWQMAVSGTTDSGGNNGLNNTKCHTSSYVVRPTGGAGTTPAGTETCVSAFGAQDMIGNVFEWVADWMQPNTTDGGSTTTSGYHNDEIEGVNDAVFPSTAARMPAALLRGGGIAIGTGAGAFALDANHSPADSWWTYGFRCTR